MKDTSRQLTISKHLLFFHGPNLKGNSLTEMKHISRSWLKENKKKRYLCAMLQRILLITRSTHGEYIINVIVFGWAGDSPRAMYNALCPLNNCFISLLISCLWILVGNITFVGSLIIICHCSYILIYFVSMPCFIGAIHLKYLVIQSKQQSLVENYVNILKGTRAQKFICASSNVKLSLWLFSIYLQIKTRWEWEGSGIFNKDINRPE